MMRVYQPFVIRVGEQQENIYPVTAEFQGASWSGTIPAELPLLTEGEIQQALGWLERGFIDRDYAKDFGSRLFQTLFPDSIREGFRAAYERVAPQGGLRIVLTLPQALAHLPWELMYDEGGRGFLARSNDMPLVRHFTGMPLPHESPEEGPLRILIITASPQGYPPLSSEQEAKEIGASLTKRRMSLRDALHLLGRHLLRTRSFRGLVRRLRQGNLVEIDILPCATRQGLQRKLIDARIAGQGYHVVHFIGHGYVDQGEGQLLLETEDHKADPVPADEFAEMIAESTVNLAVLNACQTASAVSLFSGVAQATLRRGVPAVVGMQVPVLDRAALEFAREFYGAWAAGEPIEAALADARRLVRRETPGAAADWGIPVLYMGPIKQGLTLGIRLQPLRWPRRMLAVLTALVVTGIPTLYFYLGFLPSGPPVMDGVFNVAVVEFGEQAGEGRPVRTSSDGRWISNDYLFKQLKPLEEYEDLSGTIKVENIKKPIKGATKEERARAVIELAQKINATIMIYGTLDVGEQPYKFVPEFYVTNQFTGGEELIGEHAFGEPLTVALPLTDDMNRLDLARKLEPRLKALNLFTLGLAYFRIEEPNKAVAYLKEAEKVEGWTPEQGKEVLYIFQGAALARRDGPGDFEQAKAVYQKALDLDAQYTWAYMGLGNTLLDKGTSGEYIDFQLVDEAIEEYQRALAAETKPPTAYVDAKTYFNLGLAYAFKARYWSEDCPDQEAVTALQQAIAAYKENTSVPLVQELGAKAYYQLGLVYEACGEQRKIEGKTAEAMQFYSEAAEEYQQSIAIATPETMRQPGWFGLPIEAPKPKVREQNWQQMRWVAYHKLAYTYFVRAELLGEPELYQEAIDIYKQITEYYENGGSVSDGLATEAYYNLGLTLERCGENVPAGEAYRRVQQIALADSPLPEMAEERLSELDRQ